MNIVMLCVKVDSCSGKSSSEGQQAFVDESFCCRSCQIWRRGSQVFTRTMIFAKYLVVCSPVNTGSDICCKQSTEKKNEEQTRSKKNEERSDRHVRQAGPRPSRAIGLSSITLHCYPVDPDSFCRLVYSRFWASVSHFWHIYSTKTTKPNEESNKKNKEGREKRPSGASGWSASQQSFWLSAAEPYIAVQQALVLFWLAKMQKQTRNSSARGGPSPLSIKWKLTGSGDPRNAWNVTEANWEQPDAHW